MEPEYVSASAAVISAFGWPLVAAVFLFTQRQMITTILRSVKRVKGFGIEAELDLLITEGANRQLRDEESGVLNDEAAESDDGSRITGMSPAALDAVETVRRVAQEAGLPVVRQQVRELAREYESVRAAMAPGDQRTRRMEVVFAKMRTLALAARPLLDDLKRSASPGERLEAVAILQVLPEPASLDWLADRVCNEKPFVGYHAALGLLHAARGLDGQDLEKVRQAIDHAMGCLGPHLLDPTDRGRVLKEAKQVASGVES